MPNKIKILYIITKMNWGGAQRYVYDLATNLPDNRFSVAVAGGERGLLFDKLNAAGIRTILIPALQRDINFGKELIALWKLFKLMREEKPDVVHLNSSKVGGIGGAAAFIYALTARHRPLKTIFTVHGWGFNEDRSIFARLLILGAHWLSSFFHDTVICINEREFKQAKRFIPKRKCALIHNGIGEIIFKTRHEARSFFTKAIGRPIDSDTVLIGAVTELTKNKGVDYLIDAARALRYKIPASNETRPGRQNTKYKILIIGDGEDYKKIKKQIELFGLEHQVFLLGFIPDAARYLKGLDVFVLPSVKEGLPYTILEAMAAGISIIATDVGGLPDLIQNGENGILVRPKNPEALAASLMTLLNDVPLRARLGSAEKHAFKPQFRLETMIQKMIDVYRSPMS